MSQDELIESRRDYKADTLRREDLAKAPEEQFTHWLDKGGQPHSRVVLLKQFDNAGFIWYTYQDSDKGQQIAANPQASILFYWRELERQVRIEGAVTKLDPTLADEYFYSRPEGSRFSAAASKQSQSVSNRKVMEDKVEQLHAEHPDGNVPRPTVWGGYRLTPVRFEFWQGRADRLHDRFIYTRENTDATDWEITRLQP